MSERSLALRGLRDRLVESHPGDVTGVWLTYHPHECLVLRTAASAVGDTAETVVAFLQSRQEKDPNRGSIEESDKNENSLAARGKERSYTAYDSTGRFSHSISSVPF